MKFLGQVQCEILWRAVAGKEGPKLWVSNLFFTFFSPFRYRTMVLLFHQWLSEFQCGFCAGSARAASDLSDGVSAAEIPW